jgi:hypothetical protein
MRSRGDSASVQFNREGIKPLAERLPTTDYEPATNIEYIKSKWNELLEEVMKQNRINLKTNLLNSRLLNLNGNVLTLACENEFQAEVIRSNKTFLHEKEKIVFGFAFEMNPVVLDKKETSKSNNSQLRESKHPVVQALLDEFEAEPLV